MFAELENEVRHGLMSGEKGSALVIERTITDLCNYSSEPQASAFTEVEFDEITEKWQQCTDSKQLLDSLKVIYKMLY